jgi:response regulator NasT
VLIAEDEALIRLDLREMLEEEGFEVVGEAADGDLIERARDAGAMAYLVKPFQKRDLLPAIEIATSRFAEIKALEAEVSGLRERLEARKLIERAKGTLMSQHAMTEPEAFRWIQRAAMDNRTSMRAVSELVLSGEAPEH